MYVGGDEDENIYDCDVLLHEEDKERQQSQHDDYIVIGKDSKVHLRHRSGPLEAREEVAQCKAEVKDER